MENEDGYMMLSFKNRKSKQKSKDFSLYPQYYCLLLIFGCIGILIFIMTVIGLKFWHKKMDFSQNVNISSLSGHNYLCPNDWLLNQGKCYWFSTSFKTWKQSQRDCTQLQAHLLVIQNVDELEFIQNSLKPGHFGWIGLYVTFRNLWMWIDEHFLVPELFSVIGPTDDRSCAVITGKWVYSEDCSSTFKGICQRDAILTRNRTNVV
ncbi:killer cell lectin-like receptor subfamily F member 2 isoform X2 [Piliocolobus tephrosceles]|uniref:Killer cell lectin like receptor F2 n=1 Tax=Piliocolobus tephrosceles TaxID=591936 RepID=A0A8C9GN71_9PRIM|nr:killer cell lectin-like receptor subfamily F member 2 isoform X2 [Piliocolobus tephrosceles]XP_023048192.1 killer cell lectin-like receptor subfamily F member 2 isoform X2 [Piliocolobus tephrosceles]XP_023048193.1 killer cell lectin-like receptor subfamily F member 2 isoform X2 [Piliocolobus tephrosceles]XP_023048195.1 killer cell lectin-like receptor subfamily F member 2 isoform X2 [Piliocolobus tephrosceles]XP_023048197.1 killer cell lectin-like receptor subfamily F member 2 isoform X2 [Pi